MLEKPAKHDLPKPPKGLSRAAKSWWNRIVSEWELTPEALLILENGLASFDRMEEARRILDAEGVATKDRWGQVRAHPCVAVERDARLSLLKHLKSLNLDIEPLHDRPGRPSGRKT